MLASMVFDQFFFGRDRTNAPSIDVQVGRWRNAPWLSTPTSIEDDVNPFIALWDFWTNPRYGLGLPEGRLGMDSLAAVPERLDAEGIGVSPVIKRAMNFLEFTGGAGPRTITNAQLIAALGSETDFKLRAYFVRNGYFTAPKRMQGLRRTWQREVESGFTTRMATSDCAKAGEASTTMK